MAPGGGSSSSGAAPQFPGFPTIAGSALSSALARIPAHPIDTIKARMQAQRDVSAYRSLPQAMSSILKAEGIKGLYRGFGPTTLGSVPAGALYMTSYEISKFALTRMEMPLPEEAVFLASGMLAETMSCILWVPIDVVKERMQIQTGQAGSTFYKSGWDAFRQISRGEGLRGLYKGYWATLASFGPWSALYFTFYERLKRAAQEISGHKDLLPLPWQLSTASVAGAAASWLTSPLDMVKLRMQVERGGASSGEAARYGYRGVLHGLSTIARTEGIRALWRGAWPRMVFHGVMTMVSMSLFEYCKYGVAKLVGEDVVEEDKA